MRVHYNQTILDTTGQEDSDLQNKTQSQLNRMTHGGQDKAIYLKGLKPEPE